MNTKQKLMAFSAVCMLSFMACSDRNDPNNNYDDRNDMNPTVAPDTRDVDEYNHPTPLGDTMGEYDTLDHRTDKPL